jgi:hypothetical protein
MLWYPNGRGERSPGVATPPSTSAVLEAYLDKRFSEFEDRTCLLFCQIVAGINNRIIKESNITSRHMQELQSRLRVLEAGDEPVDIRTGELVEALRRHQRPA